MTTETVPLRKLEQKLWAALARIRTLEPAVLQNARNRSLAESDRLEITVASVCREAPASRTTVASDPDRFRELLEAISDAEAARTANGRRISEDVVREKRDRQLLERIVHAQGSVIAQQEVDVHRLTRIVARLTRSAERLNPGAGIRPSRSKLAEAD